jgi:hypothetical protein
MDGTQQVVGARGEESVAHWLPGQAPWSLNNPVQWSYTSGDIHAPQETTARCPICGNNTAYTYEGHGNAVLCARCGCSFDSVLEAANA